MFSETDFLPLTEYVDSKMLMGLNIGIAPPRDHTTLFPKMKIIKQRYGGVMHVWFKANLQVKRILSAVLDIRKIDLLNTLYIIINQNTGFFSFAEYIASSCWLFEEWLCTNKLFFTGTMQNILFAMLVILLMIKYNYNTLKHTIFH